MGNILDPRTCECLDVNVVEMSFKDSSDEKSSSWSNISSMIMAVQGVAIVALFLVIFHNRRRKYSDTEEGAKFADVCSGQYRSMGKTDN